MEIALIAKYAAKFILPYLAKNKAVKQITDEVKEVANNSLDKLWSWMKPMFVKEFEGEEGLDPDVENEPVVEREIKKKLEQMDPAELEKLNALLEQLTKDEQEGRLPKMNKAKVSGDDNIVIQDVTDSEIKIQKGDVKNQKADKIYNIKKIDKADFS